MIREHPRAESLLFAGTERGLWVSADRGAKWRKFDDPLPTVPVTDIQIHPRDNDLILATHGQGVWILDDIGHLEALARAAKGVPILAAPQPAVEYRIASRKAVTGHKLYVAPNPFRGSLLTFWLPKTPASPGDVRLDILGKRGEVVRSLSSAEPHSGWNRVEWDLRYALPTAASAAAPGANPGGGGGGGFGGRAPRVAPGVYTLRLSAGKDTATAPLTVEDDPRLTITARERGALYDAQRKALSLYGDAVGVRDDLEPVRTALSERGTEKAPDDVLKATAEFQKRVEAAWAKIAPAARRQPGGVRPAAPPTPPPGGAEPGEGERPAPPPVAPTLTVTTRLAQTLARLDNFTEAPSKATLDTLSESEKTLRAVAKEARALLGKPLAALNARRKAAGLKELPAGGG